ncbi:MAG TPA: hypothetical protein VE244_08855 [Nitrososphaeraceae archaeon]|jgi:multidrug efflux pump subunit AcrB|nr:hypothetical protein [Nitrososphaeraceae archaeon]
MNAQTTLTLFAIIAAVGVLGIVIADTIIAIQEAEAGCERGAAPSTAVNASQGRCFQPR